MRLQTTLGLALTFVLLTPAMSPAQDLVLRQRVTISGPQSGTRESTQYWTADRMVTDDAESRVIIDLAGESMTVANKSDRTYFTQTFAEIRGQADALMAEMRKQIEKMPPQAREMMGKMGMGESTEPPASARKTGKTQKIAGYDASEYEVAAGPMTSTVWASDAVQPPGGSRTAEAFAKMTGRTGPGARFAQAMSQIKGIPLRMVVNTNMGPQTFSQTTEVYEVKRTSPPADVMKVPEGYEKTAPPRFQMPKAPAGG